MDQIKVAIIDDEPSLVEVLTDILKNQFEDVLVVGSCNNIKDAPMMIESSAPDLVFLDIHIPQGTGLELLDLLPVRNFEVVFITGYPSLEPLTGDYSPLGFLNKPIDLDDLDSIFTRYKGLKKEKSGKVIRNKNLF